MPADTAEPARTSPPRVPPYVSRAALKGPETRGSRVWGTIWPILLAASVGLIWGIGFTANPKAAEGRLVLYLTLGIIAVGLVPLRRILPLPVVLGIVVCAIISPVATGAYLVVVVFVGTRRRWREILAVTLVWVTANVAVDRLIRTTPAPVWWLPWLVGGLTYVSLIVLGLYLGGRRELVLTLWERAETAEREQAAHVEQARVTERTHIAREMHDVLAHRISLVALHAGALAYRHDLSREQTAETAEIIRLNAHLALTELRNVLGVLRDTNDLAITPAPPQPTLGAVTELLEECDAAGNHVTYEDTPELTDRLAGLPDQVSRNAFRILQESLTNTRKHAPGHDVLVEISGHPGGRLTLVVDNTVPGLLPTYGDSMARSPRPGVGLIGLVERARLAGGELSHGVDKRSRFVVSAWLPWPA